MRCECDSGRSPRCWWHFRLNQAIITSVKAVFSCCSELQGQPLPASNYSNSLESTAKTSVRHFFSDRQVIKKKRSDRPLAANNSVLPRHCKRRCSATLPLEITRHLSLGMSSLLHDTLNSSTNTTRPPLDFGRPTSLATRVLCGLLIVSIGIVGAFGNGCTLLLFKKHPATIPLATTRYIVASLAAVHLLGSLWNIPLAFIVLALQPHDNILYSAILMHRAVTLALFVAHHLCSLLLAVDRRDFMRRCMMRKPHLSPARVRPSLLFILFFCISYGGLDWFANAHFPYFLRPPPTNTTFTLKNTLRTIAVMLAVLSSAWLTRSYCQVQRFLGRHRRTVQTNGITSRTDSEERGLTIVLIAMNLTSTLPFLLFAATAGIAQHPDAKMRVSMDFLSFARVLIFVSYAANVWIYAAGGRTFRSALWKFVREIFVMKNNSISPQGRPKDPPLSGDGEMPFPLVCHATQIAGAIHSREAVFQPFRPK